MGKPIGLKRNKYGGWFEVDEEQAEKYGVDVITQKGYDKGNLKGMLVEKYSKTFLPTVWLPPNEYATIMSEINTNFSKYQDKEVFAHESGDYIYIAENHGYNNHRIIKKIKVKDL